MYLDHRELFLTIGERSYVLLSLETDKTGELQDMGNKTVSWHTLTDEQVKALYKQLEV